MPAFVIRWVATALAIGVAAQVMPGIQVDGLWAAIVAALLLGLVNVTLRPILLLLTWLLQPRPRVHVEVRRFTSVP